MSLHRLFFFLTILFLPSQLGLHIWPEWAMVLGRRIDYLSPTLYFTDMLLVLTIGSWVLEKVRDVRKVRNVREVFKRIVILNTKYLILFFLLAAINILFAANKQVSVYMWVKVLEYGLFGWYIIKTKPPIDTIVKVLSIAVLYSSLTAIVQFIFQHTIGGPFWFLGERTFSINTPGIARMNVCGATLTSCHLLLRAYGTFPHPNALGGFLVATLLLLYQKFSSVKEYSVKNYLLMVIVVGVIALIVTMSRSAIVTGSVLLMYLMTTRFFQEKKTSLPSLSRRPYWQIGIVIIFSLVVGLGVLNIRRLVADDESIVVRSQLNQSAIELFSGSPIVGVGLGNFLVKLPEVLPARTIYFLQPVHNIYLLMLAETGMVGIVIVCIFIFLLWKHQAPSIKHQKSSPLAYHLSLIALLLLGLADHYALTLQQGQLLLTLLVSMVHVSSQKIPNNS